MHVGFNSMLQNLDGLMTDREKYRAEMGLATSVEAAGFDSVWQSEHHFSDYTLAPNPAQFLSWMAGQTTRLRLGSTVMVLPWHDPVRVAESFSLLDHYSDGRAILGIGRGLGRIEFDGFRLNMGESRQLFAEYTEAIVRGLETGVMECDGELYKQPPVEIRPKPFKSFKNRIFASAISPQSIELMAKLGVGIMVVPQKPWPTVEAELAMYRDRYVEVNGEQPSKPILVLIVCGVHRTPEGAQRMHDTYLLRYCRSTVEHYEFDNVGFADIPGYEYYAGLSRNIERHGLAEFNRFLADLQVWGTPQQVTETILSHIKRTDAGAVVVGMSMGGMPPREARESFDLFAAEVLPQLQALDVGGDLGVLYDDVTPPHAAAPEQNPDEVALVIP